MMGFSDGNQEKLRLSRHLRSRTSFQTIFVGGLLLLALTVFVADAVLGPRVSTEHYGQYVHELFHDCEMLSISGEGAEIVDYEGKRRGIAARPILIDNNSLLFLFYSQGSGRIAHAQAVVGITHAGRTVFTHECQGVYQDLVTGALVAVAFVDLDSNGGKELVLVEQGSKDGGEPHAYLYSNSGGRYGSVDPAGLSVVGKMHFAYVRRKLSSYVAFSPFWRFLLMLLMPLVLIAVLVIAGVRLIRKKPISVPVGLGLASVAAMALLTGVSYLTALSWTAVLLSGVILVATGLEGDRTVKPARILHKGVT